MSEERDSLRAIALALYVSVLVTVSVCLWLMPTAQSAPDHAFLNHVNENPALWPTKDTRDTAVLALAVLLALAGLACLRFAPGVANKVLIRSATVAAIVMSIANLLALDMRLRTLNPGYYFEGFSLKNVMIALLVSAFVCGLVRFKSGRFVIASASFGIVVLAALSMIVTSHSTLDIGNSRIIVGEILSSVAGLKPMLSYASQYSIGVPFLVELVHDLAKADVLSSAFFVVTVLNLVCLGVALIAARRMTSTNWARFLIGAAFVASLTYTTPAGGEITAYIQGMPLRGAVACVVVLAALCAKDRNRMGLVVSAVLIPIAVLLETDFGIVAAIAIYVTTFVLHRSNRKTLVASWLLAPSAILGVLVFAVQRSGRAMCGFGCGVEYINQFGGLGFLSSPMPIRGTHVLFVAIFATSFVVGAGTILRGKSSENLVVPAIAMSMGIYGLGTFAYYANRSIAANLTQYFFPVTICCVALAMLLNGHAFSVETRQARLACVVSLVVPLVMLRGTPHLEAQISRTFNPSHQLNFEQATSWVGLKEYVQLTAASRGLVNPDIAIISEDMMEDAINAGIVPGLPYVSPAAIVLKYQSGKACQYLRREEFKLIIVETSIEAAFVDQILVCAGFGKDGNAPGIQLFSPVRSK